MMTLEEAIIHAEEVVDRCEVTDGDRACAAEHRQLAEWLRELQERRKADSCEGCMHYPRKKANRSFVCVICKRDFEDKYRPERRPDGKTD